MARKDSKGRTLRKGESVRRSDGMYIYTYFDPSGKRRYVYASSLARLREKEEQQKKDQMDGLDIYVAGKASVNFVFDRYLKCKAGLRETTRRNYAYTYDHFVRNGLGKRKIAGVKYSDILCFYKDLLDEGIAVNTIDSVQTVLYPTFELAVKDDIIRKNPCLGAMGEIKRGCGRTGVARRALTREQQKAFVRFLGEPGQLRWRPLFVVLIGTGCRIGEIIGVRWEDVDMENRMIHINHATTYIPGRSRGERARYVISKPKTEMGSRSIPMVDEVYEALLEEKANQGRLGIHCTQTVDGMSGFIFCNRFGNLLNPSSVNKAIKRIVSDYNLSEEVKAKKEHREANMLPMFSCHCLRHTFCTRLCETETNIKAIQAIMGHADIETTMNIYAEATESMKQDAMKKFSDSTDIF